jgi:hypothetical protein
VTARPRAVVAWTLAVVAGVICSWRVATGGAILHARWSLLLVLAIWAAAWLLATAATFRIPARWAVVLVVVAAVALRVVALLGTPNTSDDLYRYAWDGRVQAHAIDPYSSPPSAPELARLRDAWLWPDSRGCAALDRPPGCTRINRPSDRTIYPPVAEAWFTAVHAVGGDAARDTTWQVAGLGVDLAAVGLLLLALRRWGRDLRWVALYALCPAAVFEFVHNAHVDGLAVALMLGAFAVAIPPKDGVPSAWRDVAVGAVIGAAALVKIYPALLLVAVLCLPRPQPWRSLARTGLAAAALAVLAYSPHVIAVGPRVLGYLPGYLREEHYSGGGRFVLAGALGLRGSAATVAAVGALLATVVWIVRRRPEAPRAGAVLLAALFLVTTPVQPWYAVSAVAMASLAAWPAPAAVVLAGYPYYFAVILDYGHAVAVARLCYGAALAVMIATRLRGRDPRQIERATAEEATVPGRAVPGGVDGPPRPVGVDECLEPAGGGLPAGGLQHRP